LNDNVPAGALPRDEPADAGRQGCPPRLAQRQRLPLRDGPLGQEEEPRHEGQNPAQVRWDCTSHVGILPKSRRRASSGRLRRQGGGILRGWCRQRAIEWVEGQALPDHVPLCLSLPPTSSVAYALGFLRGKSAVRIHRELLPERRRTGLPSWATGSCVSTVSLDEARVRQDIREPEELERRLGEFDFESSLTCPGKAPPLPRAKAPSRAPRGPHAVPDRQTSC